MLASCPSCVSHPNNLVLRARSLQICLQNSEAASTFIKVGTGSNGRANVTHLRKANQWNMWKKLLLLDISQLHYLFLLCKDWGQPKSNNQSKRDRRSPWRALCCTSLLAESHYSVAMEQMARASPPICQNWFLFTDKQLTRLSCL